MNKTAIELAIERFIRQNSDHFYMLLSEEERDYIIFNKVSLRSHKFAEEVFNLLKSVGELKDVDIQNDHLDFWIDKDGENRDV